MAQVWVQFLKPRQLERLSLPEEEAACPDLPWRETNDPNGTKSVPGIQANSSLSPRPVGTS
jgi:hypothetical protein